MKAAGTCFKRQHAPISQMRILRNLVSLQLNKSHIHRWTCVIIQVSNISDDAVRKYPFLRASLAVCRSTFCYEKDVIV